ncbi:hypothetical protein HK102_010349 [Quaeritorhiza haematococci]|nr:hypothetical protein HK102_010349 [Quaeritorhiza haematococci]
MLLKKCADDGCNHMRGDLVDDAFYTACQWGHLETVRVLVEWGVEIGLGYGLSWASKQGHLEIVQFLLSMVPPTTRSIAIRLVPHVPNDNIIDSNGLGSAQRELDSQMIGFYSSELYEALILSAAGGHLPIIRLLLTHSPHIITSDGPEALSLAATSNHASVVSYLIASGALNDAPSSSADHGRASLANRIFLLAAERGYLDVVKVLVEWAESFTIKEEKPLNLMSAAMLASAHGFVDVVRFLLDRMELEERLALSDLNTTLEGRE